MKKLLYTLLGLTIAATMLNGCKGKGTPAATMAVDTTEVEASVPDTTVYGVCGEGTSMHQLELITDEGDTLHYAVDVDDATETVKGGLLAGDRMAVVGYRQAEGELVATTAINLTTLLGKWTSIDKNFEIKEGGLVESYVKAETKPWTSWKICNGQLLLNRDTFSVETLGADSLCLENSAGIFAYKRQKAQK